MRIGSWLVALAMTGTVWALAIPDRALAAYQKSYPCKSPSNPSPDDVIFTKLQWLPAGSFDFWNNGGTPVNGGGNYNAPPFQALPNTTTSVNPPSAQYAIYPDNNGSHTNPWDKNKYTFGTYPQDLYNALNVAPAWFLKAVCVEVDLILIDDGNAGNPSPSGWAFWEAKDQLSTAYDVRITNRRGIGGSIPAGQIAGRDGVVWYIPQFDLERTRGSTITVAAIAAHRVHNPPTFFKVNTWRGPKKLPNLILTPAPGARLSSVAAMRRFIAVSASVLADADKKPAITSPLTVYETEALLQLLHIREDPAATQPAVTAGPDTWNLTLLAILSHELGHIFYYDKCYNGSCDNFSRYGWTLPVHGHDPRIHAFGEVINFTKHNGLDQSYYEVLQDYQDNPAAPSKLLQIYGKPPVGGTPPCGAPPLGKGPQLCWADFLASVAPDEDFVETFKLVTLAQANPPLASLSIQIPGNVPYNVNVFDSLGEIGNGKTACNADSAIVHPSVLCQKMNTLTQLLPY